MSRTGLFIALAIGVVSGLVFGIYPELDLWVSGLFYDPSPLGFWLRLSPFVEGLRNTASLIITYIAAPAAIGLILKAARPRLPFYLSTRVMVFLLGTLALGPGLLVNMGLKTYWDRPRPYSVTQFGGTEHFVPWWDTSGDCHRNCSFVAGEPSGAFWTLAPATLAPPQWRAAAYGAALAFGAFVGVLRLIVGGHFLSDIIFAGVFVFLLIWAAHRLLFGRPPEGPPGR